MTAPEWAALPTPCALVDLDIAERNCARMRERATRLGVLLRPHVKTHKCIEGAALQLNASTGPVTVSTLAEARAFAEAGFEDITWAVPFPPAKLPAIRELSQRLSRFSILLDSEAALDALTAATSLGDPPLSVFLKVDCGYHRSGVDPDSADALALARRLDTTQAVDFRGVLTHAGHAYSCRDREELRRVAEEERSRLVTFAETLRGSGIKVDAVSLGSTPTLSVAETLEGITEIRPGNYIFHDAFQATIGACGLDDLAFSVLTTVIGSHATGARVIVDAGALALSKDEGARHVDEDAGYGMVRTPSGVPCGDLKVRSLSQEHGVLQCTSGDLPRVGDRLRIYPNHSCLAAALFESYVCLRAGRVVGEWMPQRGW